MVDCHEKLFHMKHTPADHNTEQREDLASLLMSHVKLLVDHK